MVMKSRKISTKIVNFIILGFLPPWGLSGGAKSVKIDQFFKKNSYLKLHVFKKN
jgi:hypothetical protein